MAKSKKQPKPARDAYPKLPDQVQAKPAAPKSHATRETIESIVIAFVLAFLFRTFEAEAFVIPTGSMAPTLMGRHKDVDCPQCGYRFQVGSSEEESDKVQELRAKLHRQGHIAVARANLTQQISAFDCVGGMCPMCRYVMPMRPDLPLDVPERRDAGELDYQPSYNGDRILVNKYLYTVTDPQRWDIIVFKFPGNARENYIKRLVGLPNEVIRVYHGDSFVGEQDAVEDADFEIARKPSDKLLAMRQVVHDTNYDPSDLYSAGWPLRWHSETEGQDSGWQTDAQVNGRNVRQRYTIAHTGGDTAWLRYRHLVPSYELWRQIEDQAPRDRESSGVRPVLTASDRAALQPQLITDYNMYNGRITREQAQGSHALDIETIAPNQAPPRHGIHWVGDLMVEADVEIESTSGELSLDLVEGGQHFTCRIDVATGRAALDIGPNRDAQTAQTIIRRPGHYRLAFSNVDDQLLLWVDGKVVEFDSGGRYDADELFGGRQHMRPFTSDDDPGDSEPIGIGARQLAMEISRLQVWRDIYYIAADWKQSPRTNAVTDFVDVPHLSLGQVARDPTMWDAFLRRRDAQFPLGDNQLFVMGDNSAESSDARLWCGASPGGGTPGGAYLERRQLIGKALCVYWPHSWNRIPGTPIPFPLFPNFADMRLVR